MSGKNVLTYAIRQVDTIVWTLTKGSDGFLDVYTSNAPVYVPYGEYSNQIIGDSNITLSIVKSAFSKEILSRQIQDSVSFYDNTPIKGESIIQSTLYKQPIIKLIPGSKNKYNIFFQNQTSIDGRANFSESLGNFNNWAGSAVVEYLDNNKYYTITYVNYVGAEQMLP